MTSDWPPFLQGGGVTGALMRSVDWGRTHVGPVSEWPASLKTTVGMLLHSRHPMFLWWGAELIQFYNDGYLPSFGEGKHPAAMGQRGADCWREIWPLIEPQIQDVMARGIASWNEDQLVPIFRNGRIEEVYWTYGYSPVFVESGAVGGTLVVCTETTARVLAERRLRSVHLLVGETATAIEADSVYAAAATVFPRFESDIPFALFYRRDAAGGEPRLVSSIGLDDDDLRHVDASLRDRLRRPGGRAAADADVPVALDTRLPSRGSVGPVILAEVAAPASTSPGAGTVVFGLSRQLPFDRAYQDFLRQLTDQLALALARIEAFRAQAAADSERRNLLMQAPVATAVLTGPLHRFELANPVYEQMVGRQVVGKTYLEAFPELTDTSLPRILDRVYRTGEPSVTTELLVPLARADTGVVEDRFFTFNLQPLRQPTGAIYGMMAVAADVTESVAARRVLEKAHRDRKALLAELESAIRAKDEFLAMLGHELRNPLSPIVTALQLMKLRGDGRSSKEQDVIQRQVTHLIRLVDDLLDVSKITRGKVELKREVVEISEVMARAVEIASVLFEQRSHELSIDVPRNGLRWYGDPVRLAQVVANLLTNAARYTDVGGRIELTAAADGHEIVIGVKDNGRGIEPGMLPHIFDMFVQAKRSTDRSEGGLGLGLTLVRTLVAMHGGSVVAMSEGIGKGSEFVIRIPGKSAGSSTDMTGALPMRSETDSPSRRILVVDDNSDAADLLGDMLRAAGHEVTVAHDPLAALAELLRADPEIAILDIGLPVMDGYELAFRVRQEAPKCRLIALTGYGQEHDIARGRDAGFERHLVKPVSLEELLKVVAALPVS